MTGRSWEDRVCTGILLVLAATAGAGSFAHIRDVAAGHGQGGWISFAIAGSVDLIAVASGLELRRRRRCGHPCRWPVFTLLLGVAMTLAANLATAGPGWWGAAVAVWPAVAFLAVAGLFETRVRHDPAGTAAVAGTGSPGQAARRRDVQASGRPGVSRDESSPVPVAEPAVSAVPVSAGPGRDRIVAAAPGRPRRSGSGRGAAVERMREYWVAERDAGRTPTGVELARLTGTDSSFGRRVRRQLLEEAVQQLGREADDAA